MPGGSSGGSQTIQKQTNEPWSGIQPYMSDLASNAQLNYRQGLLSGYVPSQNYVGQTAQEQQGLQQIQDIAQGTDPTYSGLLSNYQQYLGGAAPTSGSSLDALQKIASGQNAISVVQPGQNAEFQNALNAQLARTKGLLDTGYGGLGRNDGATQTAIAGRLGEVASGALANQYNQDVNARTQQEAANIANQAGAAGQLQQGQLSWAGLAPSIYNQQFANARNLIDVGGALRTDQQQALDAANALASGRANQSLTAIQNYNNLISGVGGGGYGTQTTYGQQGSPIAGLLGGAATGAGIGSSFGPWGAGIGGALGGLGGLLI